MRNVLPPPLTTTACKMALSAALLLAAASIGYAQEASANADAKSKTTTGTTAASSSTTASSNTALTIYSKAAPGAIPPELYRPVVGGYVPNIAVPGYAVIKQERPVELNAGVSTIRFTDVAGRIDPTTVMFESLTDPAGTRVLDQSFEFDLVSPEKLMERFLDKKITLEQTVGDRIQTTAGILLSSSPQGAVLKMDDGTIQFVKGFSSAQFPELPGGLISKPTLVWRVAANKGGSQQTRVTYQTDGITWWTDYNVVYRDGENANSGLLDIGAWVSIINRSGASYNDAKLKLVAGEVARAPKPMNRKMAKEMAVSYAAPMADMAAGFEEKAFFEYHLYTLGRPATIPDNSTQQIELFPVARDVKAEKALVYDGAKNDKKVDIFLRFKNAKDNGVGMPLPAGRIRVSKMDPADQSLEFIGEDSIEHTAQNEKLQIRLGSAFDVVGERKQTDTKQDTFRRWSEESFEIKVRNRKTEPVKVIVKETFDNYRTWEIRQKSHPFEKTDSRTIEFPVELQPDEEKTITYTVRYTW